MITYGFNDEVCGLVVVSRNEDGLCFISIEKTPVNFPKSFRGSVNMIQSIKMAKGMVQNFKLLMK